MSEQAEVEKEETRADKAAKSLIESAKKQTQEGKRYVTEDASWRSAEAKLRVLGVFDLFGSLFGFYEAATLGNPYIALAALFALLLGFYLMS